MNSSDVKKIASFDDIIEQHQLSRDALKALEKRLSQQANMDEFQFTSLQKEAFNKAQQLSGLLLSFPDHFY